MRTLVVTHNHVDFDALASAVAAVKVYGEADIYLPPPCNSNVRSFLNLYRDLLPLVEVKEASSLDSYRRLVMVDTSRLQGVESLASWLNRGVELHVYDHHMQQEDPGGDFSRVEPVGATTTLLVEELRRLEAKLESWEATLLAMGIYEDTGNLLFTSTTTRDISALAYLWEQGLKIETLQEFLRHTFTAGQKTLLERLISQTEFLEIKQRKMLVSRATFDGYVYGIGELMHHLSNLGEVELVFCLVEMEGRVLLLGRSYSEELNLLELLAGWEVKGHQGAVSRTLKGLSLSSARLQLLEMLEHNLPPPRRALEISSRPVHTVQAETTVKEALEALDAMGHSGFPVMEGEKLAGIVSRRDLEKARRSNLEHAPVKGFMSRKVIQAHPGDSIVRLRSLMISHNIGRVPLVGSKGELAGIVTRSDILRALYRTPAGRIKFSAEKEDGKPETSSREGPLLEPVANNLEEVEDLTGLINREMPPEMQKLLMLVRQAAEKEEARVYLVGGSIRDLLLGLPLSQDLDFVVLPEAIPFARSLARLLGGKVHVFEPFGTASIFLSKGMRLDLVTARKEFYAAPGKLPQVETSSLKNDLFRRDFSINTLACSLNRENFGQLFDFFGGRKDLQQGLIRVLYHLSFVDDPLRIIRAIRFEQRFGFDMEKDTASYLKKALRGRLLEKVSRDRLNGEVRLVFQEEDPVPVLKRMYELGALSHIFPYLKADYRTWWRLYRVKEVLEWATRREWEREPHREAVYLAALHYGLSGEVLRSVGRKMHYSRFRMDTLITCGTAVPEALEKLKGEKVRTSTVHNLLWPLPDEALLLLMAVADDPKVRDYPRLYWDSLQKVKPRLKGLQLKQMGLKQGPLYGKVLKELKEAILDGKVRTLEEERAFVLSYLESEKGDS